MYVTHQSDRCWDNWDWNRGTRFYRGIMGRSMPAGGVCVRAQGGGGGNNNPGGGGQGLNPGGLGPLGPTHQ